MMSMNKEFSRRMLLALALAGPYVFTKAAEAAIPSGIEAILRGPGSADDKLKALMPAVVQALRTERCFIYMRDPVRRQTSYTHGHSVFPDWPTRTGGGWGPEPNLATLNEPMLKKAFTDPKAQFIEDIETAAPGTLNLAVERNVFGHRALVHAPLHHEGRFYGVLETAVRRSPRVWSDADKATIAALQPEVARLAVEFLGRR